MNLAFFYDTETTGLPDFKAPSDAPQQPHLVQLAAALVDLDTREITQSIDLIIRPDGWTIPDDVSEIHGITTEHALEVGIPEEVAVDIFSHLWGRNKRIAHNESFDARIMRIAFKRHLCVPKTFADIWKTGEAECTVKLAKPICQIPPTEKMKQYKNLANTFKNPNLSEAYKHFTGKDLVGAHSAMVDVKACIEVYFGVQDLAREAVS
jgi:DNA polymerase-3 subunit epsilon